MHPDEPAIPFHHFQQAPIMKSFLNSALMALILSSFAQRVSAQASLTTVDVPVLIDFSTTLSGVNNGPFAAMVPIGAIGPAVGQLDQNAWDYYFDGSAANAMGNAAGFPGSLPDGHGVQTGGALLTGVSAVDINGHRALAIQPAGNQWTSGNLSLRVANNTGVDVNQMQVSYKAYFFNDESRSNDLRFYYSLTDALGSFVEVMPAAVVSPVVPDTAADWVENLVSFTITGITLGAGYELYVRWVGNDVGGSGSRDEFALTDIGFTAQNTSVATLFSSVGGLPPFSQSVGTPSASQVFNISGAQLTADATLTVGAPFEISLDGSLFSTSLMVPQTGGSVPPTTIYARLNSAVVGSFNGTMCIQRGSQHLAGFAQRQRGEHNRCGRVQCETIAACLADPDERERSLLRSGGQRNGVQHGWKSGHYFFERATH